MAGLQAQGEGEDDNVTESSSQTTVSEQSSKTELKPVSAGSSNKSNIDLVRALKVPLTPQFFFQ